MREMEMYAHDDLVTTARKYAEYGNTAANTAARRSPTIIMGPLLRDAVPIPGKVQPGTRGTIISQQPPEVLFIELVPVFSFCSFDGSNKVFEGI